MIFFGSYGASKVLKPVILTKIGVAIAKTISGLVEVVTQEGLMPTASMNAESVIGISLGATRD